MFLFLSLTSYSKVSGELLNSWKISTLPQSHFHNFGNRALVDTSLLTIIQLKPIRESEDPPIIS
jgi:hypothetical protein